MASLQRKGARCVKAWLDRLKAFGRPAAMPNKYKHIVDQPIIDGFMAANVIDVGGCCLQTNT